ncbi:MAG: alpha/beta hydrolase [Alphaproteobacteria bacterium]|nr:alpha/beta hydrolase [Alphaproteobacteria bacterium]
MTTFPVLDNIAKSARHTTFYLSCGRPDATPIIFVHGWPELSISWRHQLPVFAGLGFHAIAPDMRGYGRSSTYSRHEDFSLEQITADMIDLLDLLGAKKAIWVGHDWGSPVVWSIAQQFPGRCHGIASLCVPYIPQGLSVEHIVPLVDRRIYPEDKFPAGQWDYQYFYRENFKAACAGFEANIRNTVKLLFRAGSPGGKGKPAITAAVRANGGWFGPGVKAAPDFPRDASVLSEEDESRYTAALTRNGFFGPDSWYMNGDTNCAYAERAKANWRLQMPALFLHGEYDYVCETVESRLAEPMRAHVAKLSETVVKSGHWMAQEKPVQVNAALARWLAAQFPELWPAA